MCEWNICTCTSATVNKTVAVKHARCDRHIPCTATRTNESARGVRSHQIQRETTSRNFVHTADYSSDSDGGDPSGSENNVRPTTEILQPPLPTFPGNQRSVRSDDFFYSKFLKRGSLASPIRPMKPQMDYNTKLHPNVYMYNLNWIFHPLSTILGEFFGTFIHEKTCKTQYIYSSVILTIVKQSSD